MKVLVSGSHGLMGSALVEALRRRGDDILRLSHSGGDNRADTISWDPHRPESLKPFAQRP